MHTETSANADIIHIAIEHWREFPHLFADRHATPLFEVMLENGLDKTQVLFTLPHVDDESLNARWTRVANCVRDVVVVWAHTHKQPYKHVYKVTEYPPPPPPPPHHYVLQQTPCPVEPFTHGINHPPRELVDADTPLSSPLPSPPPLLLSAA